MLIQTFKDQNKRFDALKKLSHQLVPADEGRSHNDINEADTCAGRPSHSGQHEPDHIDSVPDVCPVKEASKVSLPLQSDRATGSNEDLFVFRKSVAFFSRRTSSFANSMQEVKRNTLSFPLSTLKAN